MRNDNRVVGNKSINNKSVGNEFTDNIRDVVSITDTRNDTNVLSNSEPTTANNIRDVNITCSTAATMSGITFGDGGATNNMYPIPGATIAATTEYYDDATTERGRKINAQDIQNIFVSILGVFYYFFMFVVHTVPTETLTLIASFMQRESNTTGVVSMEQIVRIKRMHHKISEGVDWDFNYSCLLTVASIIAGIGLAIDSSTTVISSMLLSPIMGPVLGMSYGLIIWDIPLIKRSMKNELLSIIYIIIFGFLIGKFDDSSSLAWARYCIRHF